MVYVCYLGVVWMKSPLELDIFSRSLLRLKHRWEINLMYSFSMEFRELKGPGSGWNYRLYAIIYRWISYINVLALPDLLMGEFEIIEKFICIYEIIFTAWFKTFLVNWSTIFHCLEYLAFWEKWFRFCIDGKSGEEYCEWRKLAVKSCVWNKGNWQRKVLKQNPILFRILACAIGLTRYSECSIAMPIAYTFAEWTEWKVCRPDWVWKGKLLKASK